MRIVVRIAVNALALWVAASLIGGIELETGLWRIVLVAVIFGVINAFVKPIITILSLPFIIVTLGLALLVINALMLLLTDALTTALEVEGFGSAVLGAAVVSVVSWAASLLLPDAR